MVRKVRAADDEDLLLAMTSGGPENDPALGFTQGLAAAELQRRGIDRYRWAVWVILALQALQVFIALMMWHPWQAGTAHRGATWRLPNPGRVVDVIGLGLVTVSAYLLWRGSEETPGRVRTWTGEGGSEPEYRFLQRRRRFSRAGFLLLGLGFALQLLSRFLP